MHILAHTFIFFMILLFNNPVMASTHEPKIQGQTSTQIAENTNPTAENTTATQNPPSMGFHAPDLSPYGMYLQAHPVVKAVMLLLLLASVITWGILLAKSVQLWRFKQATYRLLNKLLQDKHLQDGLKATGQAPCYELIKACALELEQSQGRHQDIEKRVHIRLQRVQLALAAHAAKSISILASVGAIAPFVGLFGTVWGIMNAFIGIAKSQTTNLAVVAPGIAEALLATAMGLLAAIPAVLMYNYFSRKIADYKAGLGDINAAILVLLSRDLAAYQDIEEAQNDV